MKHAPYTSEGFGAVDPASRRSAERLLPLIVDSLKPQTALDVGCGTGGWVKTLLDLGVDARGLDGAEIAPDDLEIPAERFEQVDLMELGDGPASTEPVDLVLCLEVAEHLPREFARPLTRFLAAAGRTVLFSAAIPRQLGHGHINEQPQSYWRALFAEQGLDAFDLVRPAVWDDPAVERWYAQNTLVYISTETARRVGLGDADRPQIIDIVHPKFFQVISEARDRPMLRDLITKLPGALARSRPHHRLRH